MHEDPRRALLAAARRASTIVFVCSGNMVRSAFAEVYARHLGCPVPVRSGATTYRNDRIFPETVRALLERGVDRSDVEAFRPTHLDDLLPALDAGAIFLGMTRDHLEELGSHSQLSGPVHLLTEVLGGGGEISDPVLEGADFEETFARVARCVEDLVAAL